MPPARHDGDGPEHQRDRQAARPAPEHDPARTRAQPVCERLQAGQRRAPRLGAQAAGSKITRSTRLRLHVEDRLAMGGSGTVAPVGPRKPADIPGADRRAGGAGGIGTRDQRGIQLSPRLQPGRPARGPAPAAGAAKAEARPKAPQRPTRACHPQPHADPSTPDQGASAQPVRALGRRPHALPPPARHPPDATGEAQPADAGPAPSMQRCRCHRGDHRRGVGRLAGQGAPHDHPRQRPMS